MWWERLATQQREEGRVIEDGAIQFPAMTVTFSIEWAPGIYEEFTGNPGEAALAKYLLAERLEGEHGAE